MMKLFKIKDSRFKIFYSAFRNPNSEIGLTLIEIMVAVAIMALMTAGIVTMFQGGLLSQRRGSNRATVYSEARAALDMMSREMEQAMVDERVPIKCWGMDGGLDESDTFLFVAPLNPDNNNNDYQGDLCEVGYRVNGDVLQRHYVSDANDFIFDPPFDWGPLIENVYSFNFEYSDGIDWTVDGWWDEFTVYGIGGPSSPVDVLPKAVKITLVMQYEMEQEQQRQDTFITVVNIPGSGQ